MRVGASDRVFEKCAWRLLPLIMAAYVANYVDRVNVGFAALTMNRDLAFSPSVYGFGVGVLFVGYSLFQVPANIALHRVGARRWLAFILASWGAACAAGALIQGPWSLYVVRFLLGIAEAGLVPGVVLYLTYWFPKAWLSRANALASSSGFVAFIIGGPLASLILTLDGIGGISGWQWLYLLEGVPPLLLALAVVKFLPDRPSDAPWLSQDEKRHIADHLVHEDAEKESDLLRALCDPRVLLLGLAHGCYLFAFYGLGFWIPLVLQGMGFSNSGTGLVTGLIYVLAPHDVSLGPIQRLQRRPHLARRNSGSGDLSFTGGGCDAKRRLGCPRRARYRGDGFRGMASGPSHSN